MARDPDWEIFGDDDTPAPKPKPRATVPATLPPALQELADDAPTYAPDSAMGKLPPKELAFVEHLFDPDNKSAADAARKAGYGRPDSTPLTFTQIARRVSHYPRVQEAIAEMTKATVGSMGAEAAAAIRQLIRNQFHTDSFKASKYVLEKLNPTVQKIDATVTHKFDPIKITLAELARLKQSGLERAAIMAALGFQTDFELSHYENLLAQGDVIDGEFVEVPGGDDGD